MLLKEEMKSEITENRVIRRLEKARLDFGSLRTQMALAAILIFTSCLVNFWSTLKDGFLLDAVPKSKVYVSRISGVISTRDWTKTLTSEPVIDCSEFSMYVCNFDFLNVELKVFRSASL